MSTCTVARLGLIALDGEEDIVKKLHRKIRKHWNAEEMAFTLFQACLSSVSDSLLVYTHWMFDRICCPTQDQEVVRLICDTEIFAYPSSTAVTAQVTVTRFSPRRWTMLASPAVLLRHLLICYANEHDIRTGFNLPS